MQEELENTTVVNANKTAILLFIFTPEIYANGSLKFNLIFVSQGHLSLIMFLVMINLGE